ncbi:MAG TPA: hypothetical protein VGJ20_21825 [Xanthobacteraceae bacterium]
MSIPPALLDGGPTAEAELEVAGTALGPDAGARTVAFCSSEGNARPARAHRLRLRPS